MTALLSPDRTKESAVSYFFFPGLRPRFSRQAASPLTWLGFACSNFAKKRDCSQSSKKCFRGVTIPDIRTRDNGEPSCDISCVHSEDDSIGRMFYCVKSHQKFKILDTFNELLCYCGFALRPSIVYCKQRHISSIGCTDKLLKLTHIFMAMF